MKILCFRYVYTYGVGSSNNPNHCTGGGNQAKRETTFATESNLPRPDQKSGIFLISEHTIKNITERTITLYSANADYCFPFPVSIKHLSRRSVSLKTSLCSEIR
jgi:hypothetical protein